MSDGDFVWNTHDSNSEELDDEDTPTRDKRQLGMHLPESLIEEINNKFKTMNAERILDEKQEIEKNKHFYEAIIRAGLGNPQFENYIVEAIERYR